MINVCHRCGHYRVDKTIDPSGPYAVCPECGHKQAFRQLPLLFICGPAGAGKSSVCQLLLGHVDEVVLLDADILWRAEFNRPEENYRDFFETWLRLAKNIAQSGRPVVIFCSGAIPENVEPCIERLYFSQVHYLALVGDDRVLAERLRRRPPWRQSGGTAFIEDQLNFNRWFKAQAHQVTPTIALLDTTSEAVEKTAERVLRWIHCHV